MNDTPLPPAAFRDEALMAYADDALPLPQAQAIRRAAAADPQLARRIAMFRASREGLSDAFAKTLEEPVPDHLLALFDADAVAAAAKSPATSTAPSAAPRRRPRSGWLALAASVLLAMLVSLLHREPAAETASTLAAAPSLDPLVIAALEHNASGVPRVDGTPAAREVMPLSTVAADDGRYCRDYEITDLTGSAPASRRARACRDATGWQVAEALPAVPDAPTEAYAPASGSALAVSGGRVLDPDSEAALIASGWRGP